MIELLALLAGGLLAGALGGLLGIGGGIILMPLLRFFVGLSPADAAGTCIVAVFFTTLGGSYRHYRLGHVHLRSLLPVIVSGAAAAAVSSVIFRYLTQHEPWLDLGIGLVFTLISVRMIAEGIARPRETDHNQLARPRVGGTMVQKAAVGGLAGVLPGLLGIGTGAILVPAFAFLLRTPIRIAMASSLVCFCFNALISSTFKYAQGFVEVQLAVPVCIGTLVGANLGAIVNSRSPSGWMKLAFGLVFCVVSLKYFFSFFGVWL